MRGLFKVFVCLVCNLLCDVVWFVCLCVVVVCVSVCLCALFANACVMLYGLLLFGGGARRLFVYVVICLWLFV